METVKFPKRLQRVLQPKNKRRPTIPPINDGSDSDESDTSESGGLKWRAVPRAELRTGFDDAAVLAFEELDDVEVIYEEQEGGGRVAKLAPKRPMDSEAAAEASSSSRAAKRRRVVPPNTNSAAASNFDAERELPEWSSIQLSTSLKERIHAANFTVPTDIQRQALPHGLSGRDVIGVAETGSGKTLAYGLPIIQSILESTESADTSDEPRSIKALVLTPTRELALQVAEHLIAISPPAAVSDDGVKLPPPVSVVAIVGGMSAQKQRRVLDRGVDILIATPGRLWDLIQENDSVARQIRDLRYLVLDEADRMIETGHFEELESIVKLTLRPGAKDGDNITAVDPEFAELERKAGLASEEHAANESMQTFVYSATLSKDLQQNLKKRKRFPGTGTGKKARKAISTLDDLLLRLDFRDPEPEVIDLSPDGGVVSTLQEAKIECTKNDKDLYLYYFLLRYPGRSLVFVTSIDSIRRIMPLLEILQVPAYPLHSQLQQKQRLKNLDRFKSTPNAVLIATDVAARGLDVPSVDHVVHYQLPRSADVYVHRNGRTARAKREGFSLQLCGPDEQKMSRALLTSLGRTEDVSELSIEYDMLAKLRERIALARTIDNAAHNVKKANHEQKWLRETAEALELDLGSDMEVDEDNAPKKKRKRAAGDDDGDQNPSGGGGGGPANKKRSAKLLAQRAQMKELLAQPLVARGISMKYLTSGSKSVVDDLLTSSNHQTMIGLPTSTAQQDVVKARRKSLHRKGGRT